MYAWLEQSIFCTKFKNGIIIWIDDAKEIVAFRQNLFKGKRFSTLIFTSSDFGCVTLEARKYFASEAGTRNIIKGAFIVKSNFVKILINAFLMVNKPSVPAKIFTNKEAAFKWLSI